MPAPRAVLLTGAAVAGPCGTGTPREALRGSTWGRRGADAVVRPAGVSAGIRPWRDLPSALALGYRPRDGSEPYAARLVAEQGEPGRTARSTTGRAARSAPLRPPGRRGSGRRGSGRTPVRA